MKRTSRIALGALAIALSGVPAAHAQQPGASARLGYRLYQWLSAKNESHQGSAALAAPCLVPAHEVPAPGCMTCSADDSPGAGLCDASKTPGNAGEVWSLRLGDACCHPAAPSLLLYGP